MRRFSQWKDVMRVSPPLPVMSFQEQQMNKKQRQNIVMKILGESQPKQHRKMPLRLRHFETLHILCIISSKQNCAFLEHMQLIVPLQGSCVKPPACHHHCSVDLTLNSSQSHLQTATSRSTISKHSRHQVIWPGLARNLS